MFKHIARTAIAASLFSGSAIALAAEPMELSDRQMDSVAAGAVLTMPSAGQLASIGALAWATSYVAVSPGVIVVIDGNFTARVGLAGNGTTFTHSFIVIRTP